MSDERTTGILVGLDGSQGSVAALQTAIALAKSMHAEIVAVHLFESPLSCPGSWSGRRTDGRRWRSGDHRGVRV
jgi:hypothetical protein